MKRTPLNRISKKNKQPQLKRTPISRTGKNQKQQQLKRTPITLISKKQQKRNRILAGILKPKSCESCGEKRPLDLHHKIHRSQGGTDKLDNLMFLCRLCHMQSHNINVAEILTRVPTFRINELQILRV
jgi:5-methylcytosine-specific restriction endonuclease McrA